MTAAQPSATHTTLTSEALEKLRQHFNKAPYPRVPLDEYPNDRNALYVHSLTTAYYRRNRRVIDPQGKVILDAGCGTGYKCLMLAEANPGAKIIGLDLSEDSVALARERLAYHKVENAEFYAMPIEDLPSLGLRFDYINADDVLYLIPDPVVGLQAMAQVLQPDGILRANFHSSLQRAAYFRGQQFFSALGLMDSAPDDQHIALVRQTMNALKDGTKLKLYAWNPNFETEDEHILANHLLKGDKGWVLPEFFAALKAAGLEFISMVNWWQWDLVQLFKDVNELPLEIGLGLAEKSLEEQLHLFELLHPTHRLLDLYSGLPGSSQEQSLPADWDCEQWQTVTVYLHPLLCNTVFREGLENSILAVQPLQLHNYLCFSNDPVAIDSGMATCLLPLLEAPRSLADLVQSWCRVRPFNPITLEPTDEQTAIDLVKALLIRLESLGYILLDRPI
ncbi:class I SAM-dependent methyltransferase [Alkalinema pantanalense CENA528]|uniref:class I SAM-dependent methyltransferase n=1 Tax=Alkalinema pantanalense TaxID=1620705 RepID=UPI003D6E78B1